MSRQWVKLHVDMLSHPGTGRLSDSAFRAWVTVLLMAGRVDDDGQAGTVDDLAWQLRWTSEQVDAALAETNGRIIRTGEALQVRDWAEWQAERDTSAAARMARYRERKKATEHGVTPVHSAASLHERNVTSPELELELELEPEQRRTEERHAPIGAVVAPNGKPADDAPRDWTPFYVDCGELWHTDPIRKDGSGALAWAGQLAHHAGMFCASDVELSRLLLRAWGHSDEFRFAQQPTLAPPKFGQWLNLNASYVLAVER